VNSRYWKSVAARLERECPDAGEYLLISAVLGRLGRDTVAQLESLLPETVVEGPRVYFSFADGEGIVLDTADGDAAQVREPLVVAGVKIPGNPILVRAREGEEPERIER
jgi:hypothetical protein